MPVNAPAIRSTAPPSDEAKDEYVSFGRFGVTVDIARFFASDAGKAKLEEIGREAERIHITTLGSTRG